MAASVDVWDPSAEGPWIIERLRRSGFDVEPTELVSIPVTRADIVLMAGDADGSLDALKLLRDESSHGDVPVVLLGVPPGMEHSGEGPGFGADAVFHRPVDFDPLLAKVSQLLGGRPEVSRVQAPSPERTMQLSDPDDPSNSQILERRSEEASAISWRPREPTMQLDGEASSHISEVGDRDRCVSELPPASESGSSRVSSFPGTGSRPGTGNHQLDAPEPEIPEDQRAELSPWLEELLRAADRRVFPDRPPLALHFPAASQPPEELVPNDLLEAASFAIDEPVVDDPIDAFTYVGGPIVPPPVQAPTTSETGEEEHTSHGGVPISDVPLRRAQTRPEVSVRVPSVDVTTATVLPPLTGAPSLARAGDWPEDDTVLGRSVLDGTRRGTLGAGGTLRLLWRLASLGLDAICELRLADGSVLSMTFLAGELRSFEGPIATTALASLRRRGRATERPADEAGAEAALRARVDAGTLGRFERDRLLSEARQHLLVGAVREQRLDFVLRRLDDTQPGRVLSRSRMLRRPLRAALVSAAREALDAATVASLLGEGEPGLALGPRREAALAPAEISPELLELLVRLDGHRLKDFLAAAPTEPGLAGILYALVAGDALVLTDPPGAPIADTHATVVPLVTAAAERALDADYFAILGLEPDASGGDLERAHRARREELIAIPLHALGLERLLQRRDEAVDAIDEAYRALENADRRRRYAAALAPVLSG